MSEGEGDSGPGRGVGKRKRRRANESASQQHDDDPISDDTNGRSKSRGVKKTWGLTFVLRNLWIAFARSLRRPEPV